MSSILRFTARLVVVMVGVLGIAATVMFWPASTVGPCVVEERGTIAQLPEASGLAISRRTEGIIWSHNDSGNEPVLYALDVNGGLRGRVRVPVRTRDWEDVSAGRCPTGDCLYIGDIGDNRNARTNILIHRVPEPVPGDTETAKPETFAGTYPDGPHNAEAMFVIGGQVFVVTRDRIGAIYRATLPRAGRPEMTFERIAELHLAPVTDAEASPDETSVVIRTSKVAVVYRAADLVRGGQPAQAFSIPIEGLREPQGEGIAMETDGTIFLASEGRPWNRVGGFIRLRCALPAATLVN
jgi:hypothetical protein